MRGKSFASRTLALLGLCLLCAVPGMAQGGHGSQHYLFIGASGTAFHIYQAYCSSCYTFTIEDITAASLAPDPFAECCHLYSNGMTAYADSSDIEYIYYVAANQDIVQITWSGAWSVHNLTTETGGAVAAVGSTITSFLDSTGHHALYLGANQHIYCMYYNPSVGYWVDQDLTAETGGTLAEPSYPLTSFSDSYGEHVTYITSAGHVDQLYWNSANGWKNQDLTAISSGPAPGGTLTSFADGVGEHVFYPGAFSGGGESLHMYELYWHYGINWTSQDITLAANGPLPGDPWGVTSFADANGEHVYYVNTSGASPAVDEYFFDFNESKWLSQTLNSTDTTPPFSADYLTSLSSPGGVQNVAFGGGTVSGCLVCLFETTNVLGGNLNASELTVVPSSDTFADGAKYGPLVGFIDP